MTHPSESERAFYSNPAICVWNGHVKRPNKIFNFVLKIRAAGADAADYCDEKYQEKQVLSHIQNVYG